MSFTDLARQTGLSVSATHQRVRRLERRGLIRGYAAVINPADAGAPLPAFISIKPFDPSSADDAPGRLAHLAEIEACHSVAGEENYILKVRVASPVAREDPLQEMRTADTRATPPPPLPCRRSPAAPHRPPPVGPRPPPPRPRPSAATPPAPARHPRPRPRP